MSNGTAEPGLAIFQFISGLPNVVSINGAVSPKTRDTASNIPLINPEKDVGISTRHITL